MIYNITKNASRLLRKIAAEAVQVPAITPKIPAKVVQAIKTPVKVAKGAYQFLKDPSQRFKDLKLSDNTAWVRERCKDYGVNFDSFIDSIHDQESSRGVNLLGDKDSKGRYRAFGHFQMHNPALIDANQYGKTKITRDDLNDPDIALNAMMSYLTRYGKSFERENPGKKWNPLLHGYMMWNGGPQGWNKEQKDPEAWAKVTEYRRNAHGRYNNNKGITNVK